MARRAERSESRSGVLDGSEQRSYQGDRVRPAPDGARLGRTSASTIRACCLKRRERLPCLPSHPVPWPESRNLTTSMPREPVFANACGPTVVLQVLYGPGDTIATSSVRTIMIGQATIERPK